MALLIILRKCPSISWKLLSSLWLIYINSSCLLLLGLWSLTAVWSLWWILLTILCTLRRLYLRLWIFNRRWLFIIFDPIVFLLDRGSRSTLIRLSVIFFNWVDVFIFFLILIGHSFFKLLHPIDINILCYIYTIASIGLHHYLVQSHRHHILLRLRNYCRLVLCLLKKVNIMWGDSYFSSYQIRINIISIFIH
jgi:hypothetical protein